MTFDHVVPREAGGKTEWTNILSACLRCNALKANRRVNFSGCKGVTEKSVRPFKPPRQPTTAELLRAGLEFLPNDLRESFGDYLYWTTELQS